MKASKKGIDIQNLIFKCKEKAKIPGLGASISINAVLKGESNLWLFTRNVDFNQSTAVIRVNKEEKSQRIYLSLGTYVKDKDDSFLFKVFTRQQLVDFNSKYNKFYHRNKKQGIH